MKRLLVTLAAALLFASGAAAAWAVCTGGFGFTGGVLAAIAAPLGKGVMPTTTGTTTTGST